MNETSAVRLLSALAQPIRLRAFRALVVAGSDGLTPGELTTSLAVASNTLSFHLKELTHAGLVTQERQGRHLVYRASFDDMDALLAYLTDNCCRGTPCLPSMGATCGLPTASPDSPLPTGPSTMPAPANPLNVLFLCTHNSARSILAEALLNAMAGDRFRAFSAGSSPRPGQKPNPLGLQVLQEAGIPVEGLRSKSWDEFAATDAPQMDLIITVCDNAAGEVCPIWPGHPASAHWGYPDPSEGDAPDTVKLDAFRQTAQLIRKRLMTLISLPPEQLEQAVLETTARNLARS
jgi:protein-tyrosine-phosphatase/DNA-binding transcriptional ArsR family regulator